MAIDQLARQGEGHQACIRNADHPAPSVRHRQESPVSRGPRSHLALAEHQTIAHPNPNPNPNPGPNLNPDPNHDPNSNPSHLAPAEHQTTAGGGDDGVNGRGSQGD